MEYQDGVLDYDETDRCVHHWVLDTRNNGVCKKCGAEKAFTGAPVGYRTAAYQRSKKK